MKVMETRTARKMAINCAKPSTALSGVRTSCDMLAEKEALGSTGVQGLSFRRLGPHARFVGLGVRLREMLDVGQLLIVEALLFEAGADSCAQHYRIEGLEQIVFAPTSMHWTTLSISSRAEIIMTGIRRSSLS